MRRAHVLCHPDPRADEKTLWVQAKRGVLAILRVQPDKDLMTSLFRTVTAEDEATWEEVVENEMIMDHKQQRNRRMPSTTGAEYRLEDIREYVLFFMHGDQEAKCIAVCPSAK
jgi:Ras GTPase-activating-like protein IQGAP2/3